MSLEEKSDQEIIQLLKKFGIKHGPLVGSTRGLYVKKLKDVMAKPDVSPDKTFYREEEEEVTYIHYHTPVRNEGYGDVSRRIVSKYEELADDHYGHDTEPQIHSTQAAYHSTAHSKVPITKAAGGMSLWLWLLLLAVLAAFLYFIYSSMEANTESPFGTDIHK
ncbi:emerin (Emery-Dreifuss muscular dystrophy) [Osmerus eperlanus]|uniref:emerin (Emery-Dreifuss muscular dystrophy) n=1 Tax=Osmerus eperlanus TaxID=29151 RepID=UPI002E0D6805